MYRVWFDDLEKAIMALRAVVTDDMFCKIEGNIYGDFIFTLHEKEAYIVKHTDFTVWHNYGDWRNPDWKEVKLEESKTMKYRPIDDDPVCADRSVENCEECPCFYDCYEEVEE